MYGMYISIFNSDVVCVGGRLLLKQCYYEGEIPVCPKLCKI